MSSAEFVPHNWMRNPHLQTILPRLIRYKPAFQPVWQRLDLPDGDFLDLAWSEDATTATARKKPCLVLLHGLEGSFFSPYIHGLMLAVTHIGWLSVVMHFRGCSGEPNRNRRIYHSGDTTDIGYVLQWIDEHLASPAVMAAGFSLGGNMLACYLAEQQDHARLTAAVIVSAPFMLKACSHKLDQGLTRVYQHYLLHDLKNSALRKLQRYPNTLPITAQQIKAIRNIREFDDLITAPLHQYRDANDYYDCCSALPRLRAISKPLLVIQAKDDPLMTPEVIPTPGQLSPTTTYQLTEYGGHVGFISRRGYLPDMWLEQRIPQWLATNLEK